MNGAGTRPSSSIGDVIGGVLGASLALMAISVVVVLTIVLTVRWWQGKGSINSQGNV